jgi:hypothetical protein
MMSLSGSISVERRCIPPHVSQLKLLMAAMLTLPGTVSHLLLITCSYIVVATGVTSSMRHTTLLLSTARAIAIIYWR